MPNIDYPTWPLPYDWRWANNKELVANPVAQCEHCLQWLSLPTSVSDERVKHFLRKHQQGLKCKKGREVVAMNNVGYHILDPFARERGNVGDPRKRNIVPSFQTFWSPTLLPLLVKKEFFNYLPATVVSFIRWKLTKARFRGMPPNLEKELEDFIALSPTEQENELNGTILQYEASTTR